MIDAEVLGVHIVAGEQCVGLDREVLKEAHVAGKPAYLQDGPGVEPNEHCTLRKHGCNDEAELCVPSYRTAGAQCLIRQVLVSMNAQKYTGANTQ